MLPWSSLFTLATSRSVDSKNDMFDNHGIHILLTPVQTYIYIFNSLTDFVQVS